jgi:hypothetical protein
MIPYDDLVAALSAWRARQGLPVSTMGGGSAATPSPGSGPHAQAGSGPYGQPGSGPNRGAPPAPPRGKQPSVPPPMAEEMHEVDEAEMLEEHYDNEGNDYAMSFGAGGGGESTEIGGAPERPTDQDFGGRGRGGGGGRGGRDDW